MPGGGGRHGDFYQSFLAWRVWCGLPRAGVTVFPRPRPPICTLLQKLGRCGWRPAGSVLYHRHLHPPGCRAFLLLSVQAPLGSEQKPLCV